jgi:hypothetical protein
MALQLADRVQVAATANTTVSFSLGSVVTGYQNFTAITVGNTVYYGSSDGTSWETGLGTLTSSTLLTRTTILSSSASNTAVSTFGANLNVWVDYPSSQSVYKDNTTNTATVPQLSASNGIFVNNKTVGVSYSIPSGYSATSAGPMTVASGVAVTVPSGSRWVIL